jgi:hypothetical protein
MDMTVTSCDHDVDFFMSLGQEQLFNFPPSGDENSTGIPCL